MDSNYNTAEKILKKSDFLWQCFIFQMIASLQLTVFAKVIIYVANWFCFSNKNKTMSFIKSL